MSVDESLLMAVLRLTDDISQVKAGQSMIREEFSAGLGEVKGELVGVQTNQEQHTLQLVRLNGSVAENTRWRLSHLRDHEASSEFRRGYEAAQQAARNRLARIWRVIHSEYLRWSVIALAGFLASQLLEKVVVR